MTNDPKCRNGLVEAVQKLRIQLRTAKAAIAERDARTRAAQLALIEKHDFTISAVCAIFDSPEG